MLGELVPVALPGEPLEVVADPVVDRAADWVALDRLPEAEPVPTAPDVDPLAAAEVDDVVMVALAGVVGDTVVVVGEALVVVAPAPRLTTPFCVTAPGVAAVCAAAGSATATESSIAKRIGCAMPRRESIEPRARQYCGEPAPGIFTAAAFAEGAARMRR